MAERLNAARGPVAVLIPTRGWSEVGSPSEILHDPKANAALVEVAATSGCDESIPLRELDMAINDPAFAELAADTVLGFLDGPGQEDHRQSGVAGRSGGEEISKGRMDRVLTQAAGDFEKRREHEHHLRWAHAKSSGEAATGEHAGGGAVRPRGHPGGREAGPQAG